MTHILPRQATVRPIAPARVSWLLTFLLLLSSALISVQAQTIRTKPTKTPCTIAGVTIPADKLAVIVKTNKANGDKHQKKANPQRTGQARMAQTKALGDQFCLSTDILENTPITVEDAGIVNGGQSLTGIIDIFQGIPAIFLLKRQAESGTWQITIDIEGSTAVQVSNTATSTSIPLSDWENVSDPGMPFSVSLASGACPVLVPKQVCVTLCDGTLLTLTENCSCNGYPDFYSTDGVYTMYFDGTQWVMEFNTGEPNSLTWVSGTTGSLPPSSGWTGTVNGTCTISVDPNQACTKLPAGSVCVTLPDGTKLDLASEPEDYNGALDYYTADGVYTLYRQESTSEWRFLDDGSALVPINETNPSTALTVPTTGWPTISVVMGTCVAPVCTLPNVLIVGNGTLSCQTPTLSLSAVGGDGYSFSGPSGGASSGIVNQFSGTNRTNIAGYLINGRAIPTVGTAVVSKPGMYTVMATDERGCTGTASIFVTGQECR